MDVETFYVLDILYYLGLLLSQEKILIIKVFRIFESNILRLDFANTAFPKRAIYFHFNQN